jgi:hypothetical protein
MLQRTGNSRRTTGGNPGIKIASDRGAFGGRFLARSQTVSCTARMTSRIPTLRDRLDALLCRRSMIQAIVLLRSEGERQLALPEAHDVLATRSRQQPIRRTDKGKASRSAARGSVMVDGLGKPDRCGQPAAVAASKTCRPGGSYNAP